RAGSSPNRPADVVAFPAMPPGAGTIDPGASAVFAKTNTGLKYRVLRTTGGRSPGPTDTVKVNYFGWLENGTVFDSSYQRGEPTTFELTKLTKGAAEGIQRIGEGGMIELEIPPALAYGAKGVPPDIPPNATLHFLFELIAVPSATNATGMLPSQGA